MHCLPHIYVVHSSVNFSSFSKGSLWAVNLPLSLGIRLCTSWTGSLSQLWVKQKLSIYSQNQTCMQKLKAVTSANNCQKKNTSWIFCTNIGHGLPDEREGGDGVIKELHFKPLTSASVWGGELSQLSNLPKTNRVMQQCLTFGVSPLS